ncbi:MAG: lycopene cyclase family protein [Bacteroidota bacterium]
MFSNHHYDYIIVGGGAAGLSLAYYLTLSTHCEKRVLILDKKAKTQNDRTWCFWTDTDLPYKSANLTAWYSLSFFCNDFAKSQSIDPLRYVYINSLNFYQEMAQQLAEYPSFETKVAEVFEIEEMEDIVWVNTKEGFYSAKWVFDSRLSPPVSSPKHMVLLQQFYGLWIETPEASFDASAATLMDFRISQENAVHFMYVLPISENKALVECTTFSDNLLNWEAYIAQIVHYLKHKVGVKEFSIQETERGIIPMTNIPFPKQVGKRVIPIGRAAGLTKPSTGYTFLNIQKDSQEIVQSLEETGTPYMRSSRKNRYIFYDTLLLYLIQHEPTKIPIIFSELFKKNDFPKILRFLGEEGSLWEDLRIILKLPWSPFLKAYWNYYVRAKHTDIRTKKTNKRTFVLVPFFKTD